MWALVVLLAAASAIPGLDLAVIAGPPLPANATVRVLVFACHDCPISSSYMPEIQRIGDRYAAQGVAVCVVLEDSAYTPEMAQAWAAGIIPHSPVVLDQKHTLARLLHPLVTPEAVVIGADQTVLYRGRIDDTWVSLGRSRAHASSHDLCDALDAVLAGRPIQQPVVRAIGCIIDLDDQVPR